MKILVIGFPKTGNTVLAEALKLLGYKGYGFLENSVMFGDEWKEILHHGGNKKLFQKMYKDVDVVYDMPACYYWEEFLEAFPESKLIFMKRNEEDWLQMWKTQVELINKNWIFNTINMLISKSAYRLVEIDHLLGRVMFGEKPHWSAKVYANIPDKILLKRYNEHNSNILQKRPKANFLLYCTSQGWEPICDFLELEIPKHEYPSSSKLPQNVNSSHPLYIKMHQEAYSTFVMMTIIVAFAMGCVNAYLIMLS